MTRIEKIKNMTSEEMAKIIDKRARPKCDFCEYSDKGCVDIDCKIGIKQWLEEEIEITADDMFRELGYEIDKDGTCFSTIVYTKNDNIEDYTKQIVFDKTIMGYVKRTKEDNIPVLITEKEDKAIHKKLEELKNAKQ